VRDAGAAALRAGAAALRVVFPPDLRAGDARLVVVAFAILPPMLPKLCPALSVE
jgi:hypothetical protein